MEVAPRELALAGDGEWRRKGKMKGSRDGGGLGQGEANGAWERSGWAGTRSAVRWRPEEAALRMAGGVALCQGARDACRREVRPSGRPGVP